jgi:hypothetical protein
MDATAESFDFDWLVVGSGFGGSVSALRLTMTSPARPPISSATSGARGWA